MLIGTLNSFSFPNKNMPWWIGKLNLNADGPRFSRNSFAVVRPCRLLDVPTGCLKNVEYMPARKYSLRSRSESTGLKQVSTSGICCGCSSFLSCCVGAFRSSEYIVTRYSPSLPITIPRSYFSLSVLYGLAANLQSLCQYRCQAFLSAGFPFSVASAPFVLIRIVLPDIHLVPQSSFLVLTFLWYSLVLSSGSLSLSHFHVFKSDVAVRLWKCSSAKLFIRQFFELPLPVASIA